MASQLHELSERPPRYITKEEAALINPENIDALQIYRASLWAREKKRVIPLTRELLAVEYELLGIDQRLAAKSAKYGPRTTLAAQEKSQYWCKEREWYAKKVAIPDGPFLRGLDLWRSNPKWYMHLVLVQDCAGRGGCCGRECGCCLNRHDSSVTRLTAGHCTLWCSCCEQARDFELTSSQKRYMKEPVDLRVDTWYSYRILLASSQGLTFEDLVEPLDLVDEGSDTGTEATDVTEGEYISVIGMV